MRKFLPLLILLSCLFGQRIINSDLKIRGYLKVIDSYTQLDSVEVAELTIGGVPITGAVFLDTSLIAFLNQSETISGTWTFSTPLADGSIADNITASNYLLLTAVNDSVYALIDTSKVGWLNQAETITGNWVNTTYPWADNEVADNITASSYLPLTAFDDSLDATIGATPGGELGGTWGSPTVDGGIFDDEYVELTDAFSGDVTGAYNATVVGDDSHNHNNTTINELSLEDSLESVIELQDLQGLLNATKINELSLLDSLKLLDYANAFTDADINVLSLLDSLGNYYYTETELNASLGAKADTTDNATRTNLGQYFLRSDSTGNDIQTKSNNDALYLKIAGTDNVNDTHIDWGVGANQVSAVDVPITDSGSYYTGTEVETALQEVGVIIPVIYDPTAINFGDTNQEYDIDAETWVTSGDGTPDQASHLLADVLSSIDTPYDDSEFNIRELTGAATATNPLTVQFTWTGVVTFSVIKMRIEYDGSASHAMVFELWNGVDWDIFMHISAGTTFELYSAEILVPATYIDTETVIGRFRHEDSGIATHHLEIDYIIISSGGGSGGGGLQTAIQTLSSATGDIAATNVQAAIAELDSEKEPLLSDEASLYSTLSDVSEFVESSDSTGTVLQTKAENDALYTNFTTGDETDQVWISDSTDYVLKTSIDSEANLEALSGQIWYESEIDTSKIFFIDQDETVTGKTNWVADLDTLKIDLSTSLYVFKIERDNVDIFSVDSLGETHIDGNAQIDGNITTDNNIIVSGSVDGIADLYTDVTANSAFTATPSSVITAGTGLSWSTNTLNASAVAAPDDDFITLTQIPAIATDDSLLIWDTSGDTYNKVDINSLPAGAEGDPVWLADSSQFAVIAHNETISGTWTFSNTITGTTDGNSTGAHFVTGDETDQVFVAEESNIAKLDGRNVFTDLNTFNDTTYFVGKVGIGTTSPAAPLDVQGGDFLLRGEDETQTEMLMTAYGGEYTENGGTGYKSTTNSIKGFRYGGTEGSPLSLIDGDLLFEFALKGYDGNSLEVGGHLKLRMDGTIGDQQMPTMWEFRTRDSGGSNSEETMLLRHDGVLDVTRNDIRAEGLVIADESTLGAECLSEGTFATHANWDVTNDWDDTGGIARYLYSGAGVSTLTQTQANLATALKPNTWYSFSYTFAVTTEFDGHPEMTISGSPVASVHLLSYYWGVTTQVVNFKTSAAPTDFVITMDPGTASVGNITIDNVSLKEILGGDGYISNDLVVKGNATIAGNIKVGSAGFTQVLALGSKTTHFSVDFGTDNKQSVTLTANTMTLTLDTTFDRVGSYQLIITNGGLATLTWASESGAVYFPSGTDPALTASGVDVVSFLYDGTNWFGVGSLDFQ